LHRFLDGSVERNEKKKKTYAAQRGRSGRATKGSKPQVFDTQNEPQAAGERRPTDTFHADEQGAPLRVAQPFRVDVFAAVGDKGL